MRQQIIALIAMAGCVTAASAQAADSDQDYAHTTLTGDWGGARQRLYDQGVDLGVDYLGEFAHNTSGGTRQTDAYADQIHIHAAFDFQKLWGWTGGSLHVDINDRNGSQIDAKAHLGTLLESQEIYGGGNVTRLTRFYLEQVLWNGLVDVKFGRMDIGVDFFPFACNFQNLGFCGALPGWISKGVDAWPLAQTGGVIALNPSAAWTIKFGGFEVNPNNASTSQGLKLSTSGPNTGTLMLAQLDWHTALSGQGGQPLAGTWSVGGWRNTARYNDAFLSVDGIEDVLGGNTPLMQSSVSGSYFMGQQDVFHNGSGGGLSVFGNVVQADPHTDLIDQMIDIGLLYKGPFASRPDDRLGFAIGRNRVSTEVANAERLVNAAGLGPLPVQQGYEYVTELNYQFQLWHGLALMPNVQYIRHPGGSSANRDATVLGLRVVAKF
ncbi:carbohydrate porin [Dyella acidiphila]|uniref:Carbohydrate porin n=1 Tax=Dyella acidiphila TaxID=2775866 RepID=A0ABR9GBG7_9GAMM|nr:carbohydrate porin [Dyella acidiphila]MBE1161392.1 carbohydrate porin [Dyella acidiphila]